MEFTYQHLKDLAKDQDETFANMDADIFDAKSDIAIQRALATYQSSLESVTKPFGKASTLTEGTAPTTGSEVINTTVGDMFKLELIDTAHKIAGDTILIFNPTTAIFETVSRITLETLNIPTGDDQTIVGFIELERLLQIYTKQGTFTTIPATVHYNYFRYIEVPAADGDVLDIDDDDFDNLYDAYMSNLTAVAP